MALHMKYIQACRDKCQRYSHEMMTVASMKKVSVVDPERVILTFADMKRVMPGVCNVICLHIIHLLARCCFLCRKGALTGLTEYVCKRPDIRDVKWSAVEVSRIYKNGIIFSVSRIFVMTTSIL